MSNLKTGLSYIPLDIDFFDDPKILKIEEQYGEKGGYIAIRLLQWIYRDNYYTKYSDDFPYIFAKRVGNSINGALVKEVVAGLLKCGFFDDAVFKSFQILTSRGIQKRWLKVITDYKRAARIKPEYNLLNSEECADYSEESPDYSEETKRLQKRKKIDSSEECIDSSEECIDSSEECAKNSEFAPTIEKNRREEYNTTLNQNLLKEQNILLIKKPKAEMPNGTLGSKNNSNDFIDKILGIFCEEYENSRGREFALTAKGKERKAVGVLQIYYKQKNSGKAEKPDTEQTLADFRKAFKMYLSISEHEDKWHFDNMSVSHISSQKNKLDSILSRRKNGKAKQINKFTDTEMNYGSSGWTDN